MRNWLEMYPSDFGYGRRPRKTITDSDIKALRTHAARERKAREKREAAAAKQTETAS